MRIGPNMINNHPLKCLQLGLIEKIVHLSKYWFFVVYDIMSPFYLFKIILTSAL